MKKFKNQIILNFDIMVLDFRIIIDILYLYHVCVKNYIGKISNKKINFKTEDVLHEYLQQNYMYIFDQYECKFEDFISILIVLDYLQPITKE